MRPTNRVKRAGPAIVAWRRKSFLGALVVAVVLALAMFLKGLSIDVSPLHSAATALLSITVIVLIIGFAVLVEKTITRR